MLFRLANSSLRASSRRMISSSSKRMGGDHHGEHAHVHKVFEEPFNKTLVTSGFLIVVGLGIAIPTLSVGFQNRKHGFTK